MGGFFAGIMDTVGPRIEQAHQQDLAEKLTRANYYKTASENAARLAGSPPGTLHPSTGQPLTDQDRDQFKSAANEFYNQYAGLMKGPKPLKPLLDKLSGVAQRVFGKGGVAQTPPGVTGATKPVAPSPVAATGGLGAEATDESGAPAPVQSAAPAPRLGPPPGAGTSMADALVRANPAQPTAETQAVTTAKATAAGQQAALDALDAGYAKIDARKDLSDEQKDAEKHMLALKMGFVPKTALRESTGLVKGSDLPQEDQDRFKLKPNLYYRRTWNPLTGDTTGYNAATAPLGQIRAVPSAAITPGTAREEAAKGKKFLDEQGNEIDVADLKPYQQLIPIETNRGTHWIVGNQKSKYVTVGNVVHELPVLGQAADLTAGGPGSVLGPKAVGSSSFRQQVMIDPRTNAPTIQTLGAGRQPAAPGMTGGGGASPRLSAPPSAPAGGGSAPAQPARIPPPRSAAPPAQPVPPKPVAMPVSMYNAQVKRATPVRAAAVQIVGDPASPEFVPLESYALLADDAGARERIGKAWRIIADELAKSEAGTSGGLFLSPNTWQAIHNVVGLTSAIAGSQTGVTERALADLKPEERDLLDREIAAYGSIIGLRSITGGSAAQFSAKSIERELPILGVNTASSRQFYNKLASIFHEIKSGSENISADVLKEKPQYEAAAKRLARLASGQGGKLTPPPKGAPRTAEEFLAAHPEK